MDKSKKVYMYAYLFSFLVFSGLFVMFVYNKISNDKLKERKENAKINNMISSWNYKEAIDSIEQWWDKKLDRDAKLKLLSAYLNYWNYFHKEDENSKKAIEILDTMADDYSKFYYYGYALEIIKDYTGALDNYNKWLEITSLTDSQKSLFKNQIWHVYDLKWEFDKVLAFYDEAYKLDNNNDNALSNLGRYYARIKEYEKAKQYFEKALLISTNLPLKSELCFWLSSIELEINWLTPDIDKSIEYARKAIEFYPEYAMWHLALARWLYMKNNEVNNKEIEENIKKAIDLNPNSYYTYELSAMHEYDKWNMDEFLNNLQKAEALIATDMILMDNQRETEKIVVNYKYFVFNEIQKSKKDKEKVIAFLNNVIASNLWKSVLKQQIQRFNNGIFGFIWEDKRLKDIINKLNK